MGQPSKSNLGGELLGIQHLLRWPCKAPFWISWCSFMPSKLQWLNFHEYPLCFEAYTDKWCFFMHATFALSPAGNDLELFTRFQKIKQFSKFILWDDIYTVCLVQHSLWLGFNSDLPHKASSLPGQAMHSHPLGRMGWGWKISKVSERQWKILKEDVSQSLKALFGSFR